MTPTPPVSQRVRITRLPHGAGLPLPEYQTPGASGLDLRAALDAPLTLEPGQRRDVPTGLALGLNPGLEAQVRPRSGLALRNGVTVLNSPGTVDSDYRGEIRIILINLGQEAVIILPGDRIAQLVFAPVAHIEWECVPTLEITERGAGGFGHTGR